MGWREVAAVLIVVFTVVLIQSVAAPALVQTTEELKTTGDYANEHFDGEQLITGFVASWFDMGLIAMFGMMVWGISRVVRRELGERQV